MRIHELSVMIGATVERIEGECGEERLVFHASDGRLFLFEHRQDCCESVQIEDIAGDLADLIGSPVLMAEEVSNDDAPPCDAESFTWTFYKFATAKGSVTVRWLGTSNGYYSESVYFEVVGPPTCEKHEDCRAYPSLGRACLLASQTGGGA